MGIAQESKGIILYIMQYNCQKLAVRAHPRYHNSEQFQSGLTNFNIVSKGATRTTGSSYWSDLLQSDQNLNLRS